MLKGKIKGLRWRAVDPNKPGVPSNVPVFQVQVYEENGPRPRALVLEAFVARTEHEDGASYESHEWLPVTADLTPLKDEAGRRQS